MKTALFFGSFNPIHIGHIALAGYILEYANFDELWFVVSPQNPLKEQDDLASENHRLQMVRLAIEGLTAKFKVCDEEMSLPRPSFTVDTLSRLKERYPDRNFVVIMGADSMDTITQWKNFEELLTNNRVIVYPRLGSRLDDIQALYSVEIIRAPIVEVSSTFIRKAIAQGKDVACFMPLKAHKYMISNKVYN